MDEPTEYGMCETCSWCDKEYGHDWPKFVCHRYPPVRVSRDFAAFPYVMQYYWCGEYKERIVGDE